MPPYLRLGSIPRKRHIAHPQQPGFKSEGIYYEEVVTLAGFSRAYSLVYHLRPPTRVVRIEPAGTVTLDFVDQPVLRHHHHQDRGRFPARATRSPAGVVLLANDDVIAGPLPARAAPGGALPQRRRRRSDVRPFRPGHAAHDVRPPAVSRLRLHRHPPLHDLSARIRARLRSPTCW